nr:putative late blight resistance protein homolog R1A-4 isoform X1 [Ipomoea trifida]
MSKSTTEPPQSSATAAKKELSFSPSSVYEDEIASVSPCEILCGYPKLFHCRNSSHRRSKDLDGGQQAIRSKRRQQRKQFTLVVSDNESQAGASTVHLSSKIWESPQLRHLELGNSCTVDPPSVDKKSFQTLSWVSPTYCQKEIYNKLPKLNALKIFLKDELELNCTCGSCSNPIILDHLDYLEGLEKLTISVSIDCNVTLQNQSMFPFLLEKLRLSGLNLSKWHLAVIGMLPRLKVLKLENSFHGKVWEVSEGGFRQLGFLFLEAKCLEQLKANEHSFPYLQHLGLRFCYCLEEIPQRFENIYDLQSIELKQCSPSVVAAAKQILEGLHPIRRRRFEARSIFFFHENPEITVPLKLLRVLAFVPPPFFRRMQMHFGDFIFLRYISVAQWFEGLDYIVSINCNLQTLVVSGNESQAGASTVHLPSKIWESPQLRHLELGNSYTVDPPSINKKSFQTLSWVSPTYCRKEIYNKFPKLKALKIFLKDELELNCTCGSCSNPIILDNLGYLSGLEELTISVSIDCTVTLQNGSVFPFQLEKLRLSGLNLSEWHLTVIGVLPRLKVLKLENSFHGKVWAVSGGGFRQLGFLFLEAKSLEQLKANEHSFPYLQHLGLRFCYCLEEIRQSFAHISKLQSIELKLCSPSVVAAAKQIREGLHSIQGRMLENLDFLFDDFLPLLLGQLTSDPNVMEAVEWYLNWLKGFATKVGLTDSFSAELCGLREGLRLCLGEGFDSVWVEMDLAAVVSILNGGLSREETIGSLIKDCLGLVKKLSRFRAL